MKKCLLFLCALSLIFLSVPAYSIQITPMGTPAGLVNSLVGSGVTFSNVSYTGEYLASGYFSDGFASGLDINSGIILTSGYAMNVDGLSNTADDITGDNFGYDPSYGDSDLNTLVPGYTTYDATVLEFDFVAIGDAVYFNYAFGSDEYNEWVGSAYNDVFGFFFEGANVALIPGTTTAVSINNVNNVYYSQYYHDNDPSDTAVPFAFEYDGFTDAFMASITGLTAGETYHIKLAIADAGDPILDAGVFLEAGSFSTTPDNPQAPVPEPATMLLLGSGLVGLAGLGRKKKFKK